MLIQDYNDFWGVEVNLKQREDSYTVEQGSNIDTLVHLKETLKLQV